jgi:hypothetical protein
VELLGTDGYKIKTRYPTKDDADPAEDDADPAEDDADPAKDNADPPTVYFTTIQAYIS